jgi:hypothetical protein
MNKQKLRDAATDLSKNALELIQEILIKHDMALIEECRAMLQERNMVHIGYVHEYGLNGLQSHSARDEKWNTPLSSMPFEGAIKVYARVEQ